MSRWGRWALPASCAVLAPLSILNANTGSGRWWLLPLVLSTGPLLLLAGPAAFVGAVIGSQLGLNDFALGVVVALIYGACGAAWGGVVCVVGNNMYARRKSRKTPPSTGSRGPA